MAARFLVIMAMGLAMAMARPATALETPAREAILIDFDTGAVLFEKEADRLTPPASMTKMMTAFLAFRALKDETLRLDDTVTVSEKAWRKGGSKMFIEVNSRVTVEDILRGIVVQSGNDAAIALAEAMDGSEAAFAQRMTEVAAEIGMTNTVFRNSTGWPDPQHRTTVRDLAQLAAETIRRFPKYYPLYQETSFTYNKIRQGNRNPLLYKNMGADGLKTGHTQAAGYGLAASVKRGDRRLILVVNGLASVRQRASEAERLLEWGFRTFDNYYLFKKNEPVEKAAVWLGTADSVPLVLAQDLRLTLPRRVWRKIKLTAVYEGPVTTPIRRGQELGQLRISGPGMPVINRPLLAGRDVDQLGVIKRIGAAISFLVWGE